MIVDSYMWFSKLTDTYAKTTSNDSKDIFFWRNYQNRAPKIILQLRTTNMSGRRFTNKKRKLLTASWDDALHLGMTRRTEKATGQELNRPTTVQIVTNEIYGSEISKNWRKIPRSLRKIMMWLRIGVQDEWIESATRFSEVVWHWVHFLK